MSLMTFTDAATGPHGNSFDQGYFDGELDAISKAPSALVHARASMADEHDPMWAQGYIEGYLHQIQVTHALAEKTRTP